ncbi:MAG: FGGY-family carbohydrate kinase [Anaerolineaceae bacterium]|nr:FGGY-family carbohydrate kinase [Anaerolineaceae bacterium]
MNPSDIPEAIENGLTSLGIEFGSTRIKAILIGEDHAPIASGSYDWENRYENGYWTYHEDEIWKGLQACYAELRQEVEEKYGISLRTVGALGFSGMMHGYMPFDATRNLLAPFRTWRNTTTGQAAESLTEMFQFNIPLRWSIAHLYQAILNKEPHIGEISYLTTLAGYVHWRLTGQKVLGIGEASGMFPIDSQINDFDTAKVALFNGRLKGAGISWTLQDILPKVLVAGEPAGMLSEEGAKLLDASGTLQAGIPLCPPEGDAGTGMVATNAVAERTGNVSAGTSAFAMIVLEKELSKLHVEIDMVTTPAGSPVAMVHTNTCTTDLNAWVGLFGEFAEAMGLKVDQSRLFETLYKMALSADADGGGLLAYNYIAGEPITGFIEGRPLFARTAESNFTLANFMRAHLYASLATLKIGMDILFDEENVRLEQLLGHGGFFKTPKVGQSMMAAALNVPVAVMETAAEGGAWGMALLASFMLTKSDAETLSGYLSEKVFAHEKSLVIKPNPDDVEGFLAFMERYQAGLAIQRAAVESLSQGMNDVT